MKIIKINEYDFKTPDNYHEEWQTNRVRFIINKMGGDFFKNKRILELAPFNGAISNFFNENFGCDVYCIEGRQENVDSIKSYFPNIKNIIVDNLDKPDWNYGRYDIIINWGLFYHLQFNHKYNLINSMNNCDVLFFETVIYDSFDDILYFNNEKGCDQSLTDVGGYPSPLYINNIIKNNGFNYEYIEDSCLNGGQHKYDRKLCGDCVYRNSDRKFWIIKK